MNSNMKGDFQICISVPLSIEEYFTEKELAWRMLESRLIWLNACDTDTYFEDIQAILIFLKYYCCVSHLKYYKIIFFSWKINWEELFFISRFNQTSLKETWNQKVFRLCNLLNFILLTSKLLLQKKSHVTFCENIVRRKEMW